MCSSHIWGRRLSEIFYSDDIESGIVDDEVLESSRPLLNTHGAAAGTTAQGGLPLHPVRPANLMTASNGGGAPHPRLAKLALSSPPPASAASTPGSTPSPPTAQTGFPRRWRRSDRRLRRLNTELLEAIDAKDFEEFERLLNTGANPNATCRLDLVSACHVAALAGGDFLHLLMKRGAERHRQDRLGRTPLHLAAWGGNARQMAVLLDLPEDLYSQVESEDMSSSAEEDVKKMCENTRILANVACDLAELNILLPKEWKDNIDHNCKAIKGSLPLLQPGWTPLHVSAACARRRCMRLLLAAGADAAQTDLRGRTPLDVAGTALYHNMDIDSANFTEVIRMLIKAGGTHNTMKPGGMDGMVTPLHVAVDLECLDAIKELLDLGASVACLDGEGQTPLHVCVKKQLEEPLQMLANTNNDDPFLATVDVKDSEGHTVLQAAVEAIWVPGVCVALEAGADVTLKALDGETPIHSAAALGNLDVLTEILSVAKQKDSIDFQNNSGETPLFMAIKNGHIECVKAILKEGASIKIILPGDVNVLHKAAELGHVEVLKYLIEYNEQVSSSMINVLCAGDKRGFGPIHFAVSNNHPQCVELLLAKGADVRLRTTCSPHKESTPLHLAALKNYLDMANIILKFDKTTIHEVNSIGWFPLHTAAHHVSREIIPVLLQAGADLSGYTDGPKRYRRTAIDMIVNNVSHPAQFLEDLFDNYVTTNSQSLQDNDSVVTLDYSVLMPRSCEMQQMKVVEALLKTGNRYGQKRLLVHPLMESFLYYKWKALLPFFYTILFFYACFVMSLTIFVVSVFFYKDTKEEIPDWLDQDIWGYVVYSTILLILIQELLYMNVKSSTYFLKLETWVKFGSIGMATILPPAVTIASWSSSEWPRHVATIAVLLSWVELMFLLSRFPNWGYYVLMFGKVATNVVKILLTFAFLVIGFSFSFMIQFRSQMPFEGPWSALVKTIVMMTSEFEYTSLFDEEHTKELSSSILVVRIIFLIFLILASIVLMNLMVGVAVNDINDLEILGNIRRLEKQVEFLSSLDTLVYNKVFTNLLPRNWNQSIKNKRNVGNIVQIYPNRPRWRHTKIIPSHLREAIFKKATAQKKQMDNETNLHIFTTKIEEIHDRIVKRDKDKHKEKLEPTSVEFCAQRPARQRKNHEDILKHLNQIDDGMVVMKEQISSFVQEAKADKDLVQTKIDQMTREMYSIKQFLLKLESKLENL